MQIAGGESDAELLRQAKHGDSSARHALVDRHARPLYAIACSLVGNVADAEDLVQETFLAIFRQLEAFRGEASVRTWFTRILVFQASKFRRSRAVRRAESLSESDEGHDAYAPAAPGRTPAVAVQQRADVKGMLNALSPEHREVIVLREMQGMTYDEIAGVLEVPRGTVESRLHRARAALREKFSGYLT